MKIFINKGLLLIFFIVLSILVFPFTAHAVNIDFLSTQKKAGQIENFDIFAKPDADGVVGITLHIIAENAEFTGYTGTPLFQIGTCSGNVKFNAKEVCLDVIKSASFNSKDKIGTITIKWGQYNGTAKIIVNDKYFSDAKELSNHSNKNVFSVSGGKVKPLVTDTIAPTNTVIPTQDTSSQNIDNTDNIQIRYTLKNQTNAIIFISIGVVLLLICLVQILKPKKK